jgi:hypothetical protein
LRQSRERYAASLPDRDVRPQLGGGAVELERHARHPVGLGAQSVE